MILSLDLDGAESALGLKKRSFSEAALILELLDELKIATILEREKPLS